MAMKDEKEWLLQAEDDLKSARVLLDGGRYTHSVFFCHLAVEKALKGFYYKKFNEEPTKIHNLDFLVKQTGIQPPEDLRMVIHSLSMSSVPTRYPEELRTMGTEYTKVGTVNTLEKCQEAVKWINDHLGA